MASPTAAPHAVPPTDVGTKLTALVAIFWAMAIIGTAIRLWARFIKRQRLAFNDYACVIALIFTSALAISNFLAVIYGGVGQHLVSVSPDQKLLVVEVYVFVWLWQALANTFVRLSFIDLLRHIFKGRSFNIAAWVLFGLSAAYGVACFITVFAECRPFAAIYDPRVKGTCGNAPLRFLLSAIFNFLLDLAIIILPMPMLWGLHMATSRKIALTAIFMTGAVVCVMTLLRLQASLEFGSAEAKKDFTVTVFYDALWSSLEPSLGVFNCCLPLFPAVFKKLSDYRLIQSVFSTFSRTRKSGASDEYSGSKQTAGYVSNHDMKRLQSRHTVNSVESDMPYHSHAKVIAQPRNLGPSESQIRVVNDWELHLEHMPKV